MPTLLLMLLATVVGSTALGDDVSHDEWLDRGDDTLMQQAWLPSKRNVHGEFRLLDRRGATCAQTLLYTPSLRRALQRMRKKERRAWPEGQEGHADSVRYLEALDSVRSTVLPAPGEPSGDLQTMAIEFVLADDAAFFAIFALDIDRTADQVTIESMRPLVVRDVSRGYVRRAIDLMIDSALDTHEEDE